MFVGDLSAGDHFFSFGHGPRSVVERGDYLFAGVEAILKSADFVVANLEGPVSDIGYDKKDPLSRAFRGSPDTVAQLVRAGINVVCVANNHSLQHGEECFADSVAMLDSAGIVVVGVGAELREVTLRSPTGLRLVLLGASEIPDGTGVDQSSYTRLDRAQFLARVRALADAGQMVLACLHWGAEGDLCAAESQVSYAHELVEAGARFVVGHHPHVLFQVERKSGAVIAYSLGNFVFDLPWDRHLATSGILDVEIGDDREVADLKMWPVVLNAHGCPSAGGPAWKIPDSGWRPYRTGSQLRHLTLHKLWYFVTRFCRGDVRLKGRFLIWKLRQRFPLS